MSEIYKEEFPRLLPIEGACNVRELGGCPAGKRRVKRGLIYRSGELSGLTTKDIRYLEGKNIKTIVDFRSEEEKQSAPEKNIAAARRIEAPINAGNLMGALSPSGDWVYNSSPEGAFAEMLRLYSALPHKAVLPYRQLFAILSAGDVPLLFHCSAGKDRTGLASALILHALGANREIIMADYLASAEYLYSYYAPHIETKPFMVPYMTVKEEYLLTAFKEIEACGGPDRYITQELKADIGRLRELYTE